MNTRTILYAVQQNISMQVLFIHDLRRKETVDGKIWKILEFMKETKNTSLSSSWAATSGFSELPSLSVLKKQNHSILSFPSSPGTAQTKDGSWLFYSTISYVLQVFSSCWIFHIWPLERHNPFKPVKALLDWWRQSYLCMPTMSWECLQIYLSVPNENSSEDHGLSNVRRKES